MKVRNPSKRLASTAWRVCAGAAALLCVLLAASRPVLAASVSRRAAAPKFPASAPASPASQPSWGADISQALEQAKRVHKPVLVWAGAQWSPWTSRQEETLKDSRLQREFARWVLLYVDTDRSPEQGRQLGINGVPAFRILTPFGSQVAAMDDFVAAKNLLAWLEQNYDKALVSTTSLLGDQSPDAQTLAELIGRFGNRDAAVREAVIRRLLPYPQAVAPVVEAFATGTLATRLTALEILKVWQAPLDGMDPWNPDTLTEPRLAALRQWTPDPERIRAAATQQILPAEDISGAGRQLDRLLQTVSDSEAQAICERLARYGEALLPEVYNRLAVATADRDRQRLTALRYRLLASNTLALTWPGGMERLASLDPAARRQAVEDLTSRATVADARLLTELFSNPDPLVREIALRSLNTIGGEQARQAVVKLLEDPDPNVRAAVLKQLAEKPATALVPQIAAYLAKEKDPDLTIHAVRVLRETGGTAALRSLLPLLKHDSWRVRAESAEAITQCVGGHNEGKAISEDAKAEAYVALIELLQDSDGFVISRAVTSLGHSNLVAAVKPLAEVAQSRPEMDVAAMQAMTSDSEMRNAAVPYLRKLCSHQIPAVRAASVENLCQAAPGASQTEVLAALKDPESEVRRAAADGLLAVLQQLRPSDDESRASRVVYQGSSRSSSSGIFSAVAQLLTGIPSARASTPAVASAPATASAPAATSAPATAPATIVQSAFDAWLARFQKDLSQAPWLKDTLPPLESMLVAESPQERLAAAIPLVALGRDEKALPALLAMVDADRSLAPKAATVLAWLPWSQRSEVYDQLLARARGPEQALVLAEWLTNVHDDRAADRFWVLLAREDLNVSQAAQMLETLRKSYFGERYYNPDELSGSQRSQIVAAVKGKAESGPPLQRLVALILLATASRNEAARIAEAIYNDADTDAALRMDAFEVLLQTLPRLRREALAVTSLDNREPEIRQLALSYLASGTDSMHLIRGQFLLYMPSDREVVYSGGGNDSAIVPQAPKGLKAGSLQPLLDSGDPKTAAQAGYLLVLLNDLSGIKPLLAYYNSLPKGDRDRDSGQWQKLVYQAIAVSGDDAYVPILEEIYTSMKEQPWTVREFYWTIRSMQGPKALELRKRIRSEIGMNVLR